jgi:hypothetical protein
VAQSPSASSGYSHPTVVAPSHNPSYAAPSAGYVAPTRTETHHSQVPSPSGGHGNSGSPSGSSGSSGSSGASHSKSDSSSGDKGKGR